MNLLLTNRQFAVMWLAGLVNMTGSFMLSAILPVYLYVVFDSASVVSTSLLAVLIPRVLVGPFAGVWIDSKKKKSILSIAPLLSAVLLILVWFGLNEDKLLLVLSAQFLQSIISQFYGPAETAFLPLLVESRADRPQANALNALNNNLAQLIGPLSGGMLLATANISAVIAVDAATFLLASLLILAVRSPHEELLSFEHSGPNDASVFKKWKMRIAQFVNEWRKGLDMLVKSPKIRDISLIAIIVSVGASADASLFPVFFVDDLHRDASEMGAVISARSIGGIIGGIVVASVAARISLHAMLSLGLISYGGLSLLLYISPIATSPSLLWVLVIMPLLGVPMASINASSQTILQNETPDNARGRIFTAVDASMALTAILVTPLVGFLADMWGAAVPILIVSSIVLILSGIVTRSRSLSPNSSANMA